MSAIQLKYYGLDEKQKEFVEKIFKENENKLKFSKIVFLSILYKSKILGFLFSFLPIRFKSYSTFKLNKKLGVCAKDFISEFLIRFDVNNEDSCFKLIVAYLEYNYKYSEYKKFDIFLEKFLYDISEMIEKKNLNNVDNLMMEKRIDFYIKVMVYISQKYSTICNVNYLFFHYFNKIINNIQEYDIDYLFRKSLKSLNLVNISKEDKIIYLKSLFDFRKATCNDNLEEEEIIKKITELEIIINELFILNQDKKNFLMQIKNEFIKNRVEKSLLNYKLNEILKPKLKLKLNKI